MKVAKRSNSARIKATLLVAIAFAIALGLASYGSSPVGPTPVHAQTLTVNSALDQGDATPGDGVCETTLAGGICTLRAAIEEANANTEDDTIAFDGDYDIHVGSALSVGPDSSHKLSIDGTGHTVTVDADATDQVFFVQGGADLTLVHITVTDGSASSGGGIYNNGTLTLDNVTVSNNVAPSFGQGGGIYNAGGTDLMIENGSSIAGNNASQGGGIYNNGGTVTIDASSVDSNSTGSSSCTVAGQTLGSDGGGIFNAGGDLTIQNGSSVSHNGVWGDGGGGGIATYDGTVNVSDSVVNSNCTRSGRGGGIYNGSGSVTLLRTTVNDNDADNNGGGIFTTAVSPRQPDDSTDRRSAITQRASAATPAAAAAFSTMATTYTWSTARSARTTRQTVSEAASSTASTSRRSTGLSTCST